VKQAGDPLTAENATSAPEALQDTSIRVAKEIHELLRRIERTDPGSGSDVFGMNMFGAFASDTFSHMRRRAEEVIRFMENMWKKGPLDTVTEEVIAVLDKLDLSPEDRVLATRAIERHYG
jgi:hypothetical protein